MSFPRVTEPVAEQMPTMEGLPLLFTSSPVVYPQLLHRYMAPPKITTDRGREPKASDFHLQLNFMVFTDMAFFFFFMIG